MQNPGARSIIRVIAGGYLAYLGYKILRDGVIGGGMEGKMRILGGLCSILFIAVGVAIALLALRGLSRARQEAEEEAEENAEAEENGTAAAAETDVKVAPEGEPRPRSLFDRAMAASEETEDDAEGDEDTAEADEDGSGT